MANGLVKRYGKGPDSDATDTLVAAPLEASDGHHGYSSPRGDGADNLVTAFNGEAEPAHASSGVRRLTPQEAERLQDLPDGWTNPAGDAPDSRRYAALGDAVTASVAEWLGRRLLRHVRQGAAA